MQYLAILHCVTLRLDRAVPSLTDIKNNIKPGRSLGKVGVGVQLRTVK